VETYCGLALSGQRSGCCPGLCVQAVGSGLCGQQLRARGESTLEVAPPDRRPTAFTTMRYTNRQPLPLLSYTLQQKIVLSGVMQCYRLVGKGEFSASIGTAGDCCAVSEGQVEMNSRRQKPQWRNLAGRWMCLPARRTGRRGQPSGVTDVTNPRLGRWLAWGRQDQYLGYSRRSRHHILKISK